MRALVLACYILVLIGCGHRAAIHQWGATREEQVRALPGDELVADRQFESTRAIRIEAPSQLIYPWLLQMGIGKGGFYSYDLLEQWIGLDVHSVDRIEPRWQNLRVGDRVVFNQLGGPLVQALEKNRYLLLFAYVDSAQGVDMPPGAPLPQQYFQWSWLFYLEPMGPHATRLIIRSRYGYDPSFANELLWRAVTQQLHHIMERRMMLGIKVRAERLTGQIRSGRKKR